MPPPGTIPQVAQPGSLDTLAILARALVLAVGCAAAWRSSLRWPVTGKIMASLALLLAALAWAPPLLAAATGVVAVLLLVGKLRRRSDRLDAFLSRAAGDAHPLDQPRTTFPPSERFSLLWCLAGLLVLSASLAFLELRQPYYFCQDDMLVGETPALLQGLRSVWQGVFPEWDGHVLMGVPYASAGGGRLFYPPTYLAYAIARHLLGNELAQVDVAAVLHIVAAYFVVYWVLRRLGAGAAVATAGALSVALSGPTLIMGRCWTMFIYGTVWSPLLFYAVARLARGAVGWRWALLTGAGIGVLFQVGFVQLWVTVLLLMGVAALYLLFTRRLPARRLPWLATAVGLGVALAMPLMVQQWLLTRDLHMDARNDNGVAPGLLAMLLPYPMTAAPHPAGWGGLQSQYMGEMYYFGTVFAVLPVLGLVALCTRRSGARNPVVSRSRAHSTTTCHPEVEASPPPRKLRFRHPERSEGSLSPVGQKRSFAALRMTEAGASVAESGPSGTGTDPSIPSGILKAPSINTDSNRQAWAANPWLALSLFVLVLALGNDAGLWKLMSALPILNIVNHYPFRLLPFLILFCILSGSAVAERLLRATPRRARWELALVTTTAALLLWHVHFARSSFYQYGFPPTQPLPAAMADLLRVGHATDPHPQSRVMCWAPERSSLPEFRNTMKLNLPMLDGVPSFTGYDPLTSSKPTWLRAARAMEHDPLAASRAYGVRWHVVSRLIDRPTFSSDSPTERYLESAVPLAGALPKLDQARPTLAAALPGLEVYDAGPTDPLAFREGDPRHPLPLTLSNRGIDVDVSSLPAGGRVVVNWLWYPPMRARLGAAALPCAADAWGRIVVNLPPAGARVTADGLLRVRYSPEWGTGLALGAALAAAALAAMAWLARLAKQCGDPDGPSTGGRGSARAAIRGSIGAPCR